jgi:hypothetical protein
MKAMQKITKTKIQDWEYLQDRQQVKKQSVQLRSLRQGKKNQWQEVS